MAEQLLARILNMNLTASAVILAVLVLRLLLKKAPRIFSYCLWAVVLFRLLCPVSFTAAFSPFSVIKAPAVLGRNSSIDTDTTKNRTIDANTDDRTDINKHRNTDANRNKDTNTDTNTGTNKNGILQYLSIDTLLRIQPDTLFGGKAAGRQPGQNPAENPGGIPSNQAEPATVGAARTAMAAKAAALIWLFGFAVFLFFSLLHFYLFKRRLKPAVWERGNIYLINEVPAPFVIGIFRPRIYLPAHLRHDEKEYVLLHEQIHIKRKDPAIRLLGFFALCLHWFNPLVWAAFFLSADDMEMSCDEAVIRQMGAAVKKPYASSLLSIAAGTPANAINGGVLSFCRGDTKKRIQHILHYQKSASVLTAGAALVCTAAGIVLLADPAPADARHTQALSNAAQQTAGSQTPSNAIQEAKDSQTLPNPAQEHKNNQTPSNPAQEHKDSQTLSNPVQENSPGSSHPENIENNSDDTLYKISVRSINEKKRLIKSFIAYDPFPFSDEQPLALADDCRFFINHSMNSMDYQEASFSLFASLVRLGGKDLDKTCYVQIEGKKAVRLYMESAYTHNGISPWRSAPYSDWYDSLIQSEGEEAFYKNYTLASSQTADLADCEGEETVEAYVENGKHASSGIVLYKKSDGSVLFSQDANTSRAGWISIYTGSIGGQPFILNVYIEDRWDNGEFSYQVFRLDESGAPVVSASSLFDFRLAEGSNLVYDDGMFREWIKPLETYLKHSRLVLSSQDGVLRTEQVSEADQYNGRTLSLKERAAQISRNDSSLICYHDCWYSKRFLKEETVEWLLWYNSLPEQEQLAVSSVAPELVEAKDLVGGSSEDAKNVLEI